MKALLGKKLGMTQIFDAEGNVAQVTVIEAGPCVVTQLKTKPKDGYSAIQLGFGTAKKQSRPLMGHLKASNSNPTVIQEVRIKDVVSKDELDEATAEEELKVGSIIDVNAFTVGDKVQVTGVSKGKGFAGTVKRHNFSTGPKTHGSRNYRKHGSIGSGFPENVMKGLRMAGRMGGDQVTVKNLKIILVDIENNLLAVSGAVPGPKKGIVMVKG